MATKAPNKYFDMKGNQYDYDYFSHCFATFPVLVRKANVVIPNGIEEEFIKFLIKDKKYSQGGWMVKPDGSKIRLYYPIQLYQLLLVRDKSGNYIKQNGLYVWKPKALEYYNNWKTAVQQQKDTEETQKYERFIDNISRYDPEMRKEE